MLWNLNLPTTAHILHWTKLKPLSAFKFSMEIGKNHIFYSDPGLSLISPPVTSFHPPSLASIVPGKVQWARPWAHERAHGRAHERAHGRAHERAHERSCFVIGDI